MSVTESVFNQNTLWNFVESSSDGPNWNLIPISINSTAAELRCSFLFDGMNVSFLLQGSFPDNPSSFSNLGALASQAGLSVTGYQLTVDGIQFSAASLNPSVSLSLALSSLDNTNRKNIEAYYSGNDVFIGSKANLNGTGDDDGVNGYAGNDTFTGYTTSGSGSNTDKFYGGDGIDTLVLQGPRAEYSVSQILSDVFMPDSLNGFGRIITDSVAGRDGKKSERYVERLQFSDKNVALDTDGHALQTLEFIGVVAPSLQSNLAIRGVILNLFDQPNQTMQSLCKAALDLNLISHATNTDLAKAVYGNVTNGGIAPQSTTDALVSYINANGQANFMAAVANMHINIDLVGLNNSGMDYLPA